MRTGFGSLDLRRLAPRLIVDSLCSERVDGRSRLGFAVELSPGGVRLERPYTPGPRPSEVELELELPGEGEVVIASGEVRFDEIRRPLPGSALAKAGGLIRVTGLWLARIASRDRRMLGEYVMDHRRTQLGAIDGELALASCYGRG